MAWRSILIQNPANISLSKGQIRLQNDNGDHTLPLEDITVIILESPQINLTSALLSACQDNGICILTCDKTHIPNGVLLPFQPHSRQSKVSHTQISWNDSLKARLWQKVIQCKIHNQAQCIANVYADKNYSTRLFAMAKRVERGDHQNIEAQAARDYWTKLMGEDFKRQDENILINSALNYGYAVLRAFMARSQVSYGLLPTFGIHHANNLNAFNLTDDMMEVFRPFVDYMVWNLKNDHMLKSDDHKLPMTIRQELANIGNVECLINGQKHNIGNACDKLTASLVSAIEKKSPDILALPSFTKESLSHAS